MGACESTGWSYSASMTPPKITRVARMLRKNDTWAGKLIWTWLRDRRFSEYKFRRQHSFGPHILDFFCLEALVNIELDGSQHGIPQQQAKDAERDRWLESARHQGASFLELPSAARKGGHSRD